MKTACLYIRVSTDRQAELSPESQLAELRLWAERNDYIILEDHIYIDEGISGRETKNRPAFSQMINCAKRKPKPFDAVLVWKFSRFARNRTEAVVYKSMLRKDCGIEVISASENIGEDRGTAVILESMLEAMDEYYSINLANEVKRSLKLRAERGEVNGMAPFGYKNTIIDNKKAIVQVPEQAEIVKYLFLRYAEGEMILPLTNWLNNQGVRTIHGNEWDTRAVQYMLENPIYKGYIRWSPNGRVNNRKRYKIPDSSIICAKGDFAPIVSEELFDTVNEKIMEVRKKYQKYQRQHSPNEWMLRGLLRCGACGATLTMSSAAEKSVQCCMYAKGKCAESHYITLKNANEIVLEALKEAMKQGTEITVMPEQNAQAEVSEQVEIFQKLLEQHKIRLARCKAAYEEGIDTLQEYKQNKSRIQIKIKELEKEIKKHEKEKPEPEEQARAIKNKLSDIVKIAENPTISEKAKNEALRSILHHIDFHKSTKTFALFFHA